MSRHRRGHSSVVVEQRTICDTGPWASVEPGRRIARGLWTAVTAALVAAAVIVGLQVDYSIATTTGELPPQLSQAIYFVSQEGITNALKHAAGARIRIAVDGDETTVTVTVENGPRTRESSGLETTGGGFGLDGLRQRLRALDGSLAAGPTDKAGWRLAARLPRNATRSG